MSGNGRIDGERLSRCPSCGGGRDADDNFCRRCGAAFHGTSVPIVRDSDSYALEPWRGGLPVALRGAAVVAAGTLAEAILRRLIGRVLRRTALRSPATGRQANPSSRPRADKAELADRSPTLYDDDHVVTETFLFRRVRLRRP